MPISSLPHVCHAILHASHEHPCCQCICRGLAGMHALGKLLDSLAAMCVQELTSLWQEVLQALHADDAPSTAKGILTFAYFWYNFMPLARGTAAAGYISILGLFMAAGMPVTANIAKVMSHPASGTAQSGSKPSAPPGLGEMKMHATIAAQLAAHGGLCKIITSCCR